ncbi:hypothetical protein KGF56_003255 [Candida oxycetoniae]|uniref:Meiotic recombination protein REC114 n=1 Tax=Candida oxycetoniae TaxID=497107 RepID=A0AAI9WXE6_9ASCO|nr:uncharacterized protein KGF56_003255 [Candida oxycetoniae]KAI3403988.2 hypothetical protein KGF56_003255 [Candida oxycetoniae]
MATSINFFKINKYSTFRQNTWVHFPQRTDLSINFLQKTDEIEVLIQWKGTNLDRHILFLTAKVTTSILRKSPCIGVKQCDSLGKILFRFQISLENDAEFVKCSEMFENLKLNSSQGTTTQESQRGETSAIILPESQPGFVASQVQSRLVQSQEQTWNSKTNANQEPNILSQIQTPTPPQQSSKSQPIHQLQSNKSQSIHQLQSSKSQSIHHLQTNCTPLYMEPLPQPQPQVHPLFLSMAALSQQSYLNSHNSINYQSQPLETLHPTSNQYQPHQQFSIFPTTQYHNANSQTEAKLSHAQVWSQPIKMFPQTLLNHQEGAFPVTDKELRLLIRKQCSSKEFRDFVKRLDRVLADDT